VNPTCEAAQVIPGDHTDDVCPTACGSAELCRDDREAHEDWCIDCLAVIRETEERPDLFDDGHYGARMDVA
jgi:hypothetical protein